MATLSPIIYQNNKCQQFTNGPFLVTKRHHVVNTNLQSRSVTFLIVAQIKGDIRFGKTCEVNGTHGQPYASRYEFLNNVTNGQLTTAI